MTNQLDPFYATEETKNVLLDLANERRHQIDKGWTPEHDDTHRTNDMTRLALVRLRASMLTTSLSSTRSLLVTGATILVASIEAIDRRMK